MSAIIWGIFLVLLGIQLVAHALFGIVIPFLRVGVGGFILYAGVGMILSATLHSDHPSFTTLFNTGDTKLNMRSLHKMERSTHNVVCSTSTFDLSRIRPKKETVMDINTTFGTSTVKLNPHVPTIVQANAAFARTQLPNETHLALGAYTYRTHKNTDPVLSINVNTAFGSTIVETT